MTAASALSSRLEDGPERLAVLEAENAALRAIIAEHERAQASEPDQLATRELKHRTKNILAIVQSLANQTLREGVKLADARDALDRRLAAMGRAIDILLKRDWTTAPLGAVVEAGLVHRESFADRIHCAGPNVPIGPNAAVTLTMALHELEANAIKYGAFARSGGRVALLWTVEDKALRLEWRESGCPGTRAPTHTGFGTRLICSVPAMRFKGSAELAYDADGICWTLAAPLETLTS